MHRNRATDKIEVNGRGGGGGTEGIQTLFLPLKASMMFTYSVTHFSAGRKHSDVSLIISDNLSHRRDMMNGTMAGRGLAAGSAVRWNPSFAPWEIHERRR